MRDTKQFKILVVDDDPAIIELMAEVLDAEGEVLFALDGGTALELAPKSQPDLIILDVMLPDMDGFAVCAKLKSSPATQSIPVIFVTGSGDAAAEVRGLEMGAVDYIAKPINPPIVRMRVRNQLELKWARDQLARQARTDGLTGVANRRCFDERLAQEYVRHMRTREELGVVMLDIDHFKLFNDFYGHIKGDECLCDVAIAVCQCLRRATDMAARYGGEEFACILPETGPSGVSQVGERIREVVAALRIPHARSPVGDYVTVSVGAVTGRCSVAGQPADLLAQADTLLYRAKAEGRNRCVFLSGRDV